MNEQKSSEIKEKKARLIESRDGASEMELRINELRERLQRKKTLNQQLASQLSDTQQKNNKTRKPGNSQVAAVEPFNRQQSTKSLDRVAEDDVTDFTGSKSDAKYQTLPYNTRFLPVNFNNNNNNSINSRDPGVKVASVPPQVADKPALPPKPTVNHKPILPPRQHPDKDHSGDASPQPPVIRLHDFRACYPFIFSSYRSFTYHALLFTNRMIRVRIIC